MPTYTEFALKHGAIGVEEFEQSAFLKGVTGQPEPEGKCFAFVLAYLICLRTGASGRDLLGVLKQASLRAQPERDAAWHEMIREMTGHSYYGSETLGKDLFNVQHSKEHLGAILKGIGLEPEGNATRFESRFWRFTKVGEHVATEKPSYSTIRSAVHIMAAASQPISDRDCYCFFDPNFGECRFASRLSMVKFIADFYSRKLINRGYRPNVDNVKSPPPLMGREEFAQLKEETKSLVLTVQRFREAAPQVEPQHAVPPVQKQVRQPATVAAK